MCFFRTKSAFSISFTMKKTKYSMWIDGVSIILGTFHGLITNIEENKAIFFNPSGIIMHFITQDLKRFWWFIKDFEVDSTQLELGTGIVRYTFTHLCIRHSSAVSSGRGFETFGVKHGSSVIVQGISRFLPIKKFQYILKL